MLSRDRKLNRLRDFNYSDFGYYFVTVCTKDRVCYFGDVRGEEMVLNIFGQIVKQQWLWLGEKYQYIELDQFNILPNHIHGIIIINPIQTNYVGTGRDLSLQRDDKIKSLSELIGAFKTTSSKLIHQLGLSEFQWQRSFYDRIIRNEKELDNIRKYILENVIKWNQDINNPKNQ
ncbi:MAG: hypothetical protein A3J62_01455 [Candidatus Buchananbacteria bacterium RIFCSPHIGHO2_02_FULL_38_8]|uniref:Transposase IS200-like domain-containing protein n=2 Tax=Candidatus Buchananiibacteriota TaxID=1817903 RepID=A0A1G1Y0T2_9BACT|nr:MAG: hypothetical protein A2731_04305 [Candidatus Buchananbacteria bacterium RIFCSPHIGHO2_01_FULL_39_8]OGY47848.1 MAG: hypothetical protein A3J62_01455 [Candidatus Buchananbacteria bacterium RIFCSPHIGHO2_02_FULL_38_8]